MKKRLIRADATQSIETIIKDVASDGRDILKQLENFKFKMAQKILNLKWLNVQKFL